MRAAVFLLTCNYVLAILIAEVFVKPLCGIGSIGIAGGGIRRKLGKSFISRSECEVIEESVTPVSFELYGILALIELYNAAGGLREGTAIGESDFTLIHAVNVEILYLLVRIGRLAVADREVI